MIIKRLFDLIVSFVGILMTLPVYALISTLIIVKMPGPVLFIQTRIGKNGQPFRMIKFRTMKVDHGGNSISVKGESRITALGSYLRRYKLDELPELWNVLKGDMSLVGPRPDIPGYADKLEGDDRNILNLRPGITGPASIKYANEEEILANVPDPVKYNDEVIFPDKVKINLDYYNSRSFSGDLKIIWQTIFRSYS